MKHVTLPDIGCDGVICRYGEIATKGRNRIAFENRLVEALRRALRAIGKVHVVRERGRIFLTPGRDREAFSAADLEHMRARLPFVSGLASASPGRLVDPTFQAIEETLEETFAAVYGAFAARHAGSGSIRYCMRARRSDKTFPMRSQELEIAFAERWLDRYDRLKVDLTDPDLLVEVEIRADRAFISYERIEGPGGLPAGSGARVTALLSGGIDSPVACYLMMKRGCLLDFVTFHSDPYTPPELIAKVATLARLLNRFQPHGHLAAVNLLPLQKAVRDTCRPKFRTVLYRRFMVRIAAIVARCFGGKALVTGDNVGQVASQTIENLGVISAASPVLTLRPLLTYDKQETVTLARRIGTLQESQHDVPDSCTVFAPANPATAARLDQVLEQENRLDGPGLIRECLALVRAVDLDSLELCEIPRLMKIGEAVLAETLETGGADDEQIPCAAESTNGKD